MAEHPADLAREHRLADGRSVVIRPIRPADKNGERAFLERLSPEARRRRFTANADGRSCELGIVVGDDWHHTGVAQLLMAELTRAARARGLRTMQGLVLRDNRDMLDFVSALGFDSAPSPEDERLVRITKQL